MKIRNFLWGTVCALVCVLLLSMQVLAYTYYVPINVTSASNYTMLPVIASVDNTALVAGSYISSSALDTDVTASGTGKPHMVADNKTLFASDFAVGTKNFHYEMGNAAETAFEIICGYNGYVTTSNHADLVLGNDFKIEASGYVDTTAGAGKNILNDADEVLLYISGAGTLTASVEGLSSWTLDSHLLTDTDPDYIGSADSAIQKAIAVNSDGDIYAAYIGSTYHSLFVDVSTDGGATWANSLTVADADTDYLYVAMCIDSLDNVYVAYIKQDLTTSYVKTQHYDGAWSGEEAVESQAEIGAVTGGITIAVDSADAIHIAYGWEDSTAHYVNIRYGTRANKAGAWGGLTWITSESTNLWEQFDPQMAIDADDDIHLVWTGAYELVEGATNIRYREYNGAWQAIQDLTETTTTHDCMYPSIAVSEDNHIHVAYFYDGTAGSARVKYREYTDSWQVAEDVMSSTGIKDYYSVSIAVDGDGVIFIAANYENDYKNYESHDDGSGWSTPAIITGASTNCYYVNLLHAYYPIITGIHTNIVSSGLQGMNYTDSSAKIYYITYTFTPGTVTLSGAITTGEHDIILELSGGQLELKVDGILKDNDAFAGNVISDTHDWIWMQGNVMPYVEYFKVEASGSSVLWYQPNDIISGTTLPDRQGTAQNGVITWGTNPVTVNVGVIVGGGVSPTSTAGATATVIPPIVPPGETIPVITDNPMPPTATSPIDPFFDEIEDVTGGVFPVAWQKYAYSTLLCAGFIIFAGSRTQSFFLAVTAGGLGLGLSYLLHFFADIWIFWIFGFLALAALLLDARKSW